MKTFITRSSLMLALFALAFALPVAAQEQDTTAQPPPEVTSPPPSAEAPSVEDQEAARQAAEEWLAYIDEGDIAQSYETAAQLLKDQVTQEDWEQSIGEVQGQTGELQSRSFSTAQALPAPSEDPQGEYLAVQYASDYARLPVQESVVLVKEEDTWKVAGYLVRPAEPTPAGPQGAPSPQGDTTGAASDTTGGQ